MKFGNSSAILDDRSLKVLNSIDLKLQDVMYDNTICTTFTKSYLEWIKTSTLNTLVGIDNFPHVCYSNGTTEAFDRFYAKNSSRRFRCFRGEYMYHQLSWRNNYTWKFLEDARLDKNDAVVISLPFSDTGNKHLQMDYILHNCSALGIPVLVDCAYFGICSNINFNLNYECITDVVFSLSKTFPVAHARIGIRLTKKDDDDPLFVVNKSDYVNRIGCMIGQEFINNFSPDYIPSKYKDKQLEMCNHLSVEQSDTVLFGIGNVSWQEYNRGNETNRLSFHKYLHLPLEVFYNDC